MQHIHSPFLVSHQSSIARFGCYRFRSGRGHFSWKAKCLPDSRRLLALAQCACRTTTNPRVPLSSRPRVTGLRSGSGRVEIAFALPRAATMNLIAMVGPVVCRPEWLCLVGWPPYHPSQWVDSTFCHVRSRTEVAPKQANRYRLQGFQEMP